MIKRIGTILKWYLLVSSIYLLVDGLIHLLDIKLINVDSWPVAPLIYSQFVGHLYGAFAILLAILGFEGHRDISKYRNFLYIVAAWGVLYGSYLVFSSLNIDFMNIFKNSPSIYVWIPFYNLYLLFEAGLLYVLAALTFLYWKSGAKN